LVGEILNLYEKKLESVTILPSSMVGDFEVKLDDRVIFSKRATGRLPNPGEVEELLAAKLFGG
jgi:predicted Rdx family selenoprotein